MDEAVKARLTRRSIWTRAVFMLIFLVAYSVAEVVLGIVVIIQFLMVLFTGTANANLLRLGNNLSTYIAEVLRFMSFNTETQGFPFGDWPDEAVAEDNVWLQDPDDVEVAATPPAAEHPAAESSASGEEPDAGSVAGTEYEPDSPASEPSEDPPAKL